MNTTQLFHISDDPQSILSALSRHEAAPLPAYNSFVMLTRDLSSDLVNALYVLTESAYDKIDRDLFIAELSNYDYTVVILNRALDKIVGFANFKLMEGRVDNREVSALYLGYVIVHKEHWQENLIAKPWLEFSFAMAAANPQREFYWIGATDSYHSYRFLDALCREYYPCYFKATPVFEESVLDFFGSKVNKCAWDKETGIIHSTNDIVIRQEIAGISDRELMDPVIQFFCKSNPGWIMGDEMLTIARIAVDNMTRLSCFLLRNSK